MKSLTWFCALVVLLLACDARAAPLRYDLTGTGAFYDGVSYAPLTASSPFDFRFTLDGPAFCGGCPSRDGPALALSGITLTANGQVTSFPDSLISYSAYDTGARYLGQLFYYDAVDQGADSFAWMMSASGAGQVAFLPYPHSFVGFHAEGDRTEPYWRSTSPVELMDVTGFTVTSAAPATGVPEPSYWSLAGLGALAMWVASGVARFRRQRSLLQSRVD
jgi:hypothetical protein